MVSKELAKLSRGRVVALDAGAVRKARLRLKSGMPAEVFIATGSRSMLSYLVKPLKDQLSRSFRND